ncbi:hypothetical protein [Streptomyces tubercidicus]|uniref:hypothetical protein n=1 Tax=Streptomyces tubercidicus TaxID=47759 RepID=UPI0036C98450
MSAQGRQDKLRVMQDAVASCMRKQGFQYVPSVPPQSDDQTKAPSTYAEMKAYRTKYGFGYFAGYVYPNDPNLDGASSTYTDPNDAIVAKLTPSQKQAYDKALHGKANEKEGDEDPNSCSAQGEKAAGMTRPPAGNADQLNALYQRQNQEFNTDPKLVAAARTYASCLRGKGYIMSGTSPSEVESVVEAPFAQKRVQMTDSFSRKLDVDTARPLMNNEIKAALDDLECGKNYFPLANALRKKQDAAMAKIPGTKQYNHQHGLQ